MARPRHLGVLIALAVFIVLAAVIRVFGGPLYEALLRLHGPAAPGH